MFLGVFTVELEKDSLYEWHVKLLKVDSDSQLASDLKQMELTTKQNSLHFHFVFKETFPYVFLLFYAQIPGK